MNAAITVLIADDHPIFRKGLREVIDADAALRIVAEAADGETALAAISELRPDIAVLDVDMPGQDGFAVMRAVRDRRLPTEILFLTMHKDERFLNSALDAGVKGYVLKDGAVTDIIAAVKAVHAGEHFLSPALSTLLVSRTRRVQKLSSAAPALETLSPTERKVLKLLAEFKTTKEIADVLCVSPRTVDHHRANMALKLDLRGNHALTRFAVNHQSVIPDP